MTVPDHLGYAVIGTDGTFAYPRFCVHGPDPVDTDYEAAEAQRAWLDKQGRPYRYTVCKLVPVNGPPGDEPPVAKSCRYCGQTTHGLGWPPEDETADLETVP